MAGGLKAAMAVTQAERRAVAAGTDVPLQPSNSDYLTEPSGSEMHWTGIQPKNPPAAGHRDDGTASLVSSHSDDVSGMSGTSPTPKSHVQDPIKAPPVHQVTPDQLMAQAQAMLAEHKVQSEAQLGAGPSVGDRDDAGSLLPDWLKGAAGR